MNFEEFLQPQEENQPIAEDSQELDVQKTVVEELAADKVVLADAVSSQEKVIDDLKGELESAKIEASRLQGEIIRLKGELAKSLEAVAAEQAQTSRVRAELAAEREKQFDLQERNPNALALLDRDVELPDRFPGETRDQVLEALKASRDRAESEGCLRAAQVLESVLCANEANGTLAAKREELRKLFAENGNIINGTVIEALKKRGLAHKNGEDYLLVDEIIRRAY